MSEEQPTKHKHVFALKKESSSERKSVVVSDATHSSEERVPGWSNKESSESYQSWKNSDSALKLRVVNFGENGQADILDENRDAGTTNPLLDENGKYLMDYDWGDLVTVFPSSDNQVIQEVSDQVEADSSKSQEVSSIDVVDKPTEELGRSDIPEIDSQVEEPSYPVSKDDEDRLEKVMAENDVELEPAPNLVDSNPIEGWADNLDVSAEVLVQEDQICDEHLVDGIQEENIGDDIQVGSENFNDVKEANSFEESVSSEAPNSSVKEISSIDDVPEAIVEEIIATRVQPEVDAARKSLDDSRFAFEEGLRTLSTLIRISHNSAKKQVIDIAGAISRSLIGPIYDAHEEVIERIAGEALDLVSDSNDVVIYCHEKDHSSISSMLSNSNFGDSVRLKINDEGGRGFTIETHQEVIDGRVESKIDDIIRQLYGENGVAK